MKKVLLCCAVALFMFSCSNEEEIQKPDTSKEVTTVDPAIGYESPFDYPDFSGVPYGFKNGTDLDFELQAYIGLGFHDGVDDLTHFGIGSFGDFPNLSAGEMEYGNTIPTLPILIPAFSGVDVSYSGYRCPVWHSLTPSDPILFDANTGIGGATHSEAVFLAKMGKVYYFKYRALKTGVEIDSGLVKVFFPEDAGGPNWILGGIDVNLGDKLVYEDTTRELCITTDTSISAYSYYSEFTYAGQDYIIQTKVDAYGVHTLMEYN